MQAPPKSRLTRAAAMAAAVACVFGMAPMAASATVAPLADESDNGPAVTPDSSPTTLRIATSGFVDSFNPFTSIYLTPTNIFRYMYESLVQNDAEDGSPTEGLAESWETNDEGTDLDVHAARGHGRGLTASRSPPKTSSGPTTR